MAKHNKILLLVAGTAVVAVAIAYVGYLRPIVLRGKQVRSCADMNTIKLCLEEYREAAGEYPRSYRTAIPDQHAGHLQVDGFGFAFHYESTPDSFILVSYGLGGKPELTDYLALRDEAGNPISVGGSWSSDQVLSDLGWLREGCK